MDIDVFAEYCQKIQTMLDQCPDWVHNPVGESMIGDYLRTETSHGFEAVLRNLLKKAVELVTDNANRHCDIELFDMAATLYANNSTINNLSYTFSAYYFVICIAAVAMRVAMVDDVQTDYFDENDLISFDVSVSLNETTDPQEKALNKLSVKLFDYSRVNQLVHFRSIKSGTLPLISSQTPSLVQSLLKNNARLAIRGWSQLKVKTIYRCKECKRISVGKYDISRKTQQALACKICDAENTHNRKSCVPLKEKLTIVDSDFSCQKCERQISLDDLYNNNFVCPNCDTPFKVDSFPLVDGSALKTLSHNEVFTERGDADAKEACKSMLSKAKSMERNFGLHVLYLAYGFLRWKDTHGIEYNSPLLLLPVNLELDRSKGMYFIQPDASNNGFEVNKTLVNMLKAYSADCSIVLPDLINGMPEAFFGQIKERFSKSGDTIAGITSEWSISPSLGIGLFHYQKLQLEKDIADNKERYLEHPVIRRLCGDERAVINENPGRPDSKNFLLKDADSSQEDVVDAAIQGRSFVLQGPPGSGKSQTITNIIATAIGGGKTVLFVTQKASARSIIFDNLEKCSTTGDQKLSDFVLDFDSFNKQSGAIGKTPFVDSLNECIRQAESAQRFDYNDDSVLQRNAVYKNNINTFMQRVNSEDGKRVFNELRTLARPEYFDKPSLRCINSIPNDISQLQELIDCVAKYYKLYKKWCENCDVDTLDYKRDPLFGCRGDSDIRLCDAASDYISVVERITSIFKDIESKYWDSKIFEKSPRDSVAKLHNWSKFPLLESSVLKDIQPTKLNNLISYANDRKQSLERIEQHEGVKIEQYVNKNDFQSFDIDDATKTLQSYSSLLSRVGNRYKQFLDDLFGKYTADVGKHNYANAVFVLGELKKYRDYCLLKSEYAKGIDLDQQYFDFVPATSSEWTTLIEDLKTVLQLLKSDYSGYIRSNDWFLLFDKANYNAHIDWIKRTAGELDYLIDRENELASIIYEYFPSLTAGADYLQQNGQRYAYDSINGQSFQQDETLKEFLAAKKYANRVYVHKHRLKDLELVYNLLQTAKANGTLVVIDELIERNIISGTDAENTIRKSFHEKELKRLDTAGLVRDFDLDMHKKLMDDYTKSDKEMIEHGSDRLYSHLSTALINKIESFGKASKRIQKTVNYSIKQTIKENFDYIKILKPCFMMSPLNVSQYIDIDTKFDLVIFDEASQIFVEDALASIVRGEQIIIAGDSKQLPPCDFFRAGDASQDDAEIYFEEEKKLEADSLLDQADKVLNESDTNVSLAWHYRSRDESLIAFSNNYMGYGLISFPSAVKNPNDGIVYHQVKHNAKTCYSSGKNGTHTNEGETDAIVKLIWQEMNDPERKDFSIGVVAFSNAQALAIETAWEKFKENLNDSSKRAYNPSAKSYIDNWEKQHENEPIVFCNLDTMQGDERDTMIISICYSEDSNGKFNLPYLGRIRLESGKKRINVAITRSRHRMIVVSTLPYSTLNAAVAASSAPDSNKSGALMLAEFLKYAESFTTDNSFVSAVSLNEFTLSIKKVLEDEGFVCNTDIGRSACKINVGVRKSTDDDSFALGIIVDDPTRHDFDSPREYARLTEEILTDRYGWNIYRVFPISWINDYKNEKDRLLNAVRNAVS